MSKQTSPMDISKVVERCLRDFVMPWQLRGAARSRLAALVAVLLLMLIAWRSQRNHNGSHYRHDNGGGHALLQPDSIPPTLSASVASVANDYRQFAQLRTEKASGFDLSRLIVPVHQIQDGGPGKDGIPALTNPLMIGAAEASYLQPDDPVIGVAFESDPRAYPLRILDHHEIVNDRVGQTPIAVTYCPLCDSSVVFDRRTPLGERDFGVSGLLYNSNVLMYDRGGKSDSLWSQLATQGISGPGAELPLVVLPLEVTTWHDWRARYPNTLVMSTETGHRRDYQHRPYAAYFKSRHLVFPVPITSNRLPLKSRVLGVWTKNASRAYPIGALGRKAIELTDVLDGKRVTLAYNPVAKSLRVVTADDGVSWMYSFWFAWYAFRPDTDVFSR